MASQDQKRSKQGTAGNRKYVTLTILQKLEIIIRLGSGLKSMNHQVKEIPKWNTTLISCAAQIF